MWDAEYLTKREQRELDAAFKATDQRVRQLHLELADAYTFRLNEAKRLQRREKVLCEPAG